MGDVLLAEKYRIIFGIPNARMSSYPYFQHFHALRRLDNFASGIPNAITSQSPAAKNVAADADPRLPHPGTLIECAQAIAFDAACAAAN
jgi:hypothetical protein